MRKSIFNWSGGKDSSLCLHQVLQGKEYKVERLVTTLSGPTQRISMHGVRQEYSGTSSFCVGRSTFGIKSGMAKLGAVVYILNQLEKRLQSSTAPSAG